MVKEINEVKITYLAETSLGLANLLLDNYNNDGKITAEVKSIHTKNCCVASALLIVTHDMYDDIPSDVDKIVEITEKINDQVFSVELKNDIVDKYCSIFFDLQNLIELLNKIIAKYKN